MPSTPYRTLLPYVPEALADALGEPPATGLLVLAADAGWTDAGLQPGDVVVAVAGIETPDMENLAGALVGEAGSTTFALVRRGKRLDLDVPVRMDGFQPLAVTQGVPVRLRAPETPSPLTVPFDDGDVVDAWYRMVAAGRHIGFEHHQWSRQGSGLRLVSEVGFDRGDGPVHVVVVDDVRFDGGRGRLDAESGGFEAPLTGTAVDYWVTDPGGEAGPVREWHATASFAGEQTRTVELVPPEALPEFVVNHLGMFMAPVAGEVVHATPVYEGNGRVAYPGFPAGVVSVVAEVIEVAGRMVPTVRVDKRVLGQTQSTSWIDEERRVVAFDYGWARSELAEVDVALGETVPDLTLRTLD